MDNPFEYSKHATGKMFLGRKKDVAALRNLMLQNENVVIFGPPKSGKESLIQQAFFEMRISRKDFTVCEMEMLDIRDCTSFLCRLGDTVIRSCVTTPAEYRELIGTFLKGTHFVFDQRNYSDKDQIVSLNWDLDAADMEAMLKLPYNISRNGGQQLYIILKEFQNISLCDGYEKLLKMMEEVMKEQRSMLDPASCSFLMTGSKVNAMKEIFEHWRFFHRTVEILPISPIDEKEVIEHVIKGFLSGGKVVDRENIKGVCSLLKGNIWYVNHYFSICDHLSKGYITDAIMVEALQDLLSIHQPRFEATVSDLTTFQLNLLRAITEGHSKFSSAEVIRQYGLSSSANVKRLKDALAKKEIVTFSANEEPMILDPLFEYWVKKYFFHQKLDL